MRTFEQRPIFLSGKVVLEDGTPPPEPATIELVCHGQVRPQAYTDSKGRFSFQVGQQGNVLMDASVSSSASNFPGRDNTAGFGGFPGGGSGGLGTADFMGCELRAALPGFRSEAVVLNRRSMFDNPDIGTIILRRLANVQGTAISFTTLNAPKEAKKSFEKAQKAMQQKNPKHAEAAKELEKAVQIYPEYAAAWYMLGECKLAQKDEESARQAFEKSVAADAKYTNPYLQLAVLELRASKWKEAAEITGRLNQLNPYLPQAHYFNAIANYNLGKMDLAEKAARNAIDRSDSRFPRAHHLLGAVMARQGNFPSAAEQFRQYLKLAPNAQEGDQLRKQLKEWEGLGVIQAEASAPATNKEKP
jgi:tetratricopeptide (TPR) repeat protein